MNNKLYSSKVNINNLQLQCHLHVEGDKRRQHVTNFIKLLDCQRTILLDLAKLEIQKHYFKNN